MLQPDIPSGRNFSLFNGQGGPSESDPFYYESVVTRSGYSLVAGVDEAGRGPLAGPVVAAAAILPNAIEGVTVRDSKKMTERERESAFPVIQRQALTTGVGVVSSRYIDEFNILNASLEAMKRAVLALDPPPDFLLVDGIHKIPIPIPQRCLKKGDQKSQSISAASVVAKVYRDRMMQAYHAMYPEYGFDKNKGYGTRRHLEALKWFGPSPLHRHTFKGVIPLDEKET